jgi:phosphatidylserine decarboxylase
MYFLKLLFHRLAPQRLVTQFAGLTSNSRIKPFKNFLIWVCLTLYDVKTREAIETNPYAFGSFNDFFIRQLKPTIRPIEAAAMSVVSPADGTVSQLGKINGNQLIQAKGKHYTLESLLAHQHELVQAFKNGSFSTIYLAPNDYHRVHMPFSGVLKEMIYVPGKLFSVCPVTARGVNNLFARNERVISVFETELGLMAVIMVGAMAVGSMTTAWAGQINPPRGSKIRREVYDYTVTLNKGDEMGYFTMGSTVITLFAKDRMELNERLKPESGVLMGSLLGVGTI